MNPLLALSLTILLSIQVFAKSPDKTAKRNPSQEGQTCVTFNGAGAKKTFLTLYPFTQGKVTAIAAETTRSGETNIATENIFCRVYNAALPSDLKAALIVLNKAPDSKFQCGYFVASDGVLSACSDPQ